MTEEELLSFVRSSVGSVWALELLLLLRRSPDRAWSADELVRELRSSDTIVADALIKLQSSELIASHNSLYAYAPSSWQLRLAADGLQRMYSEKPVSVVKAIMEAPNEKLRIFSRAFRVRD